MSDSDVVATDPGRLLLQVEQERARLADVFRQAPAFMCVLGGMDHVFELANDRYYQLVGYRDIIGRPVREALPEVDGQGYFELLDKVYRTGESVALTDVPVLLNRVPEQPAEERHLDFVFQALRVRDREVTGIVVVGVDVTDRRRADQRLLASEERYRTLFESMDEGYCIVEMLFDKFGRATDYRFLEINPAFEKHTGMTEATGRRMRELIPNLESRWFDIYGRVALTGESVRFVDEARSMDGRWFDVYAFRLGEAGSNKVAILFNDITAPHRAEEQLRQSEERYRVAAALVSDVIWTNTAVGLMQGAQRGWENFTGQSREEYAGRGWAKAVHPEDSDASGEAWSRAVAEKRTFVLEYRVRRRDGQWRLCSVRAAPVLDADDSIREWVGVLTDITERRRDEENLQHLATELSEASLRKDAFLATLAHELRNPLAPILTGLELMRLASGQEAAVERARSMVARQVTQMVRLVDDLMDVSRISRGTLELRRERVDLASVLDSAMETSLPLIEEMGHQLAVTLPQQPLFVDADPTRLAQVFLNLLNNASKYGERGGHIHLGVEARDGEAVVTVKDSGVGIAADQLPRIFEMFTQADESLEKSRGGLGIGLSLVRRLVEMHGGKVEARSEGPGRGSEFVVRLPLATEAARPAGSVGAAEPHCKAPRRVLVVDDNRDGADSLTEMLTIMGNETRTAYDGQEGLDMAEAFRPEVLLLDIGLPKLNGYEVCQRIREQPWGKDMVLIAMTGWGKDEDRRRSHEAGFDLHLVKPVDAQLLVKTLAGLQVQ